MVGGGSVGDVERQQLLLVAGVHAVAGRQRVAQRREQEACGWRAECRASATVHCVTVDGKVRAYRRA
eukprot:4960258-Prymnesium_polylepis.1